MTGIPSNQGEGSSSEYFSFQSHHRHQPQQLQQNQELQHHHHHHHHQNFPMIASWGVPQVQVQQPVNYTNQMPMQDHPTNSNEQFPTTPYYYWTNSPSMPATTISMPNQVPTPATAPYQQPGVNPYNPYYVVQNQPIATYPVVNVPVPSYVTLTGPQLYPSNEQRSQSQPQLFRQQPYWTSSSSPSTPSSLSGSVKMEMDPKMNHKTCSPVGCRVGRIKTYVEIKHKKRSGVSPKRNFKCDQCGKAYTRRHNLLAHKLSAHTNGKHFICKICKAKFKRESDFIRHNKEQHTNCVKPFVCAGINPDGSKWGCGKRFFRKDQLKSHLSTNRAWITCLKNLPPGARTEVDGIVIIKSLDPPDSLAKRE